MARKSLGCIKLSVFRFRGIKFCKKEGIPKRVHMFFHVLERLSELDEELRDIAVLIPTTWDDWFKFSTTFNLFVVDSDGVKKSVGLVKIGRKGMVGSRHDGELRAPKIPTQFNELKPDYFSIGQDENYYETLASFDQYTADRVLLGLRDMAADISIFEENKNEIVVEQSLLREITEETVLKRFGPLAARVAELTPYDFSFRLGVSEANQSYVDFKFVVRPDSKPPTNIHVLIGRNGVGKTRALHSMVNSLVKQERLDSTLFDRFTFSGSLFSSLVSVSFSAFDTFIPPRAKKNEKTIRYEHIGIRKVKHDSATKKNSVRTKGIEEMAREFIASAIVCREGIRRSRWASALRILESDPLFEELKIEKIAGDQSTRDETRAIFKGLSSGHKVVLLSITKLVELVDERTLVVMDEPEAHLHPPLLSAFIRALSELLKHRNGVSIIATHSPVILQEIPRSCANIFNRSGYFARVDKPDVETFGENIGVLTREVFGLEVLESGFHRYLSSQAEQVENYDEFVARFDGQLGSEARALARILLLKK